MKLLTYKGHIENGRLILPDDVVLPTIGEFTITFIEEELEVKAERQRKVFNEVFESLKDIDDEPLGEEFDEIMRNRPKFARTPEELDL